MPSDESKGSQLDAIGSLAQRQLDNTHSSSARTGGTTLGTNGQSSRPSRSGSDMTEPNPNLGHESDRPNREFLEWHGDAVSMSNC